MLEQLCDTKKQGCSFLCGKVLSRIEKIDYPCEESSAFAWRDGRFIEYSGFLDHRRLVIIERWLVSEHSIQDTVYLQIPPDSSSFLNDMASRVSQCDGDG